MDLLDGDKVVDSRKNWLNIVSIIVDCLIDILQTIIEVV